MYSFSNVACNSRLCSQFYWSSKRGTALRRKIEQLIRFKAVSLDAGYEQRIIALLPAPQISNEVVRGLFCDSSRFMDKAMALGDVECMHSLLL